MGSRHARILLVLLAVCLALGVAASASARPISFTPEAGFGKALDTAGVSISVPSPVRAQFSGASDFTYEAWVKPSASADIRTIYSNRGFFGLLETWIFINTDNKVHFWLGNQSNAWDPLATTVTIPDGEWTHLAFVKNGNQASVYINGQLSASKTLAPIVVAANPNNLGGRYIASAQNEGPFKGEIDELRIFDTALSQSTIDSWRFRGSDPTHPNWTNLVNYWSFDWDPFVDFVADRMNLSHGTITGSGVARIPSTVSLLSRTDEDTPVSGRLAHYDADGGALTTAVFLQPAHGLVTMTDSSTASFTYTPLSDYYGTDTFEYYVSDGVNVSTPMTATVIVTPLNDLPVSHDGTVTMYAEASLSTSVAQFAEDVEGDELAYASVTTPSHGAFQLNADGTFTYEPDDGYVGTDSFSFYASDASGDSQNAVVHIVVRPYTSTVSLSSASKTLAAYGDTYDLEGMLTDDNGVRAGRTVVVQASTNASDFADTALAATTAANGGFSITVAPVNKTYYRVKYAGDATHTAGISAAVSVVPCAAVSTPEAPKSVLTGASFNVIGTLKPSHGGVVRIYKYRLVSGEWVDSGYVDATVTTGGAVSTYSARLKLTSGDWRLKAYHPTDTEHASSWSAGYASVSARTEAERVVGVGLSLRGRSFRWGGNGPLFFDSSGFVRYVYARRGIALPRTAKQQFAYGPKVAYKNRRPGDLIFYYKPVSHVGIYIGKNKMLQCNRFGVHVSKVYPGVVGVTRPLSK